MRHLLLILLFFLVLYPSSPLFAWFSDGQDAHLMVSGIGFGDPGYLAAPGDGLLFNHPMKIATDNTRLLLADTRNNRILIWNSLPTANTSPDLVLGQGDLSSNTPGDDMGELNWPAGVAAGGGKVVVADTENNRLLIWNNFPSTTSR